MKTIITESLPKKDGEGKSKLFLADVSDEGVFTKLTFTQWKAHSGRNDASELARSIFLGILIRQVDRFSLKIDFNTFVRENYPSFTQKVEWLLNTGGCIYTKRGLIH